MRSGSVGINLTAASHVFLMEPALNPALEEQAIGRAWRMGQKRSVAVKARPGGGGGGPPHPPGRRPGGGGGGGGAGGGGGGGGGGGAARARVCVQCRLEDQQTFSGWLGLRCVAG
jgi:hypothetical protein